MSETSDDTILGLAGNRTILCHRAMMTTSSGIWLGDHPLNFSLPIMLYQICIIVVSSRLTHAILRHLGQPLVVSQIMTGILLGPSCLGRTETFERMIFPPRSRIQLNTIALLAFMLFIFVVGVKTDLSMIPRAGKKALAIALTGTILPFSLVMLLGYAFSHSLPAELREKHLLFFLASKWCLTSYTVLSCVLEELNLLTSKLGRLAMSASLIADFHNIIVSSIVTAIMISSGTSWSPSMPMVGLGSFFAFLGFVVFIVFVARPLTLWMIRRTPEGEQMEEAYFISIIGMALGCGLISEVIGHHATLGPFLLGLALPGGAPLGVTLVQRLDRLVSGVFLPVFLAIAGFRTDVSAINNVREWGFLEMFILVCILGKFVGVMLPCLYCKMPIRDALSLGIMMNSKGIYEISVANQWQEAQIINQQMYAVIVLSIVFFGGSTAPLIKFLYKPSQRFFSYKRRTIQHSKPNDEIRILACIHTQDNVPAIINLLEAFHATVDSPICIYILHVVQLIGRAAAVLVPHKPKRSTTTTNDSDHIVNAFRFFEKQNMGRILVLPYVGISPYATIHDDVCSLALDKKVSLVIVPFHKHIAIDDTMEVVNPAIQTINTNILTYSPCSVGILVDHGLSHGPTFAGTHLLHHVAVYFFGGADDREALAIATRMAGNPAIGLTVIRFRLPEERRENGKEEKMDDEAVNGFRFGNVDDERVAYREEVVKDAEGTVGVIRETVEEFSLLIVGRREGRESPMTAGMSMWSECPELGVIGDLLASTGLGKKVSTLVVQQQTRVGGQTETLDVVG